MSCLVRGVIPFNSRPHKEVDAEVYEASYMMGSFNSRPHKEVDKSELLGYFHFYAFQFTTSQGGRPILAYSGM